MSNLTPSEEKTAEERARKELELMCDHAGHGMGADQPLSVCPQCLQRKLLGRERLFDELETLRLTNQRLEAEKEKIIKERVVADLALTVGLSREDELEARTKELEAEVERMKKVIRRTELEIRNTNAPFHTQERLKEECSRLRSLESRGEQKGEKL